MLEKNTMILFMFLIVLLCILCVMLGYFYAKTKIRYFYNKFRQEEMKMMNQMPKIKVVKPTKEEEEFLKNLMQHTLSEEDYEKMMQEMNENDENDEKDKNDKK